MEHDSTTRRENVQNSGYICGVVEGFYGRPWTLDQRKHLYKRQNQLGLTTYVYAPKDDKKHRAAWRNKYTDEEISVLRCMIESATESNVNFVYAISPGLDIVYSSPEEMETLKEKLDQVRSIGCNSFAVLFDDIEVAMKEKDEIMFKSFALAQVHVANTIFEYLKPKTFMFCPTEYCEARADPSLQESSYLNLIGENLAEEIHIMWTGPHVISRYLTVEHLAEVGKVIRRKPLIWDNLHANDYDLKKVFMGPIMHRSVEIKKHTSGFLSNPNGRYEANFVPFHTLSDWNAADRDVNEDEQGEVKDDSPLFNIDCNTETVYNPDVSIINAVVTWIDEFSFPSAISSNGIPQIDATVGGVVPERRSVIWLADLPLIAGMLRSEAATPPVLSESVIQTAIPPEEPTSEINSLAADYSQPMETEDEETAQPVVFVDEDVAGPVVVPDLALTDEEIKQQRIALLTSFVEMYYLPFESGPRIKKLFRDLLWLLENASVMKKKYQEIETLDPLQSDWLVKYEGINEFLTNAIDAFFFITQSINKSIIAELVPLAFKAHTSCVVLIALCRWMMQGNALDNHLDYLHDDESFTEESWIHQNGFNVETLRVLGGIVDNVEKMFNNKVHLPLSIFAFDIRPFSETDQEYIGGMVTVPLTTNQDFLSHRLNNFVDRNIAPFLNSGGQYNFICEKVDETGRKPVCYASAHADGIVVANHIIENKRFLKEKYKRVVEDSMVGATKLTEDWINFLNESQTPVDIDEWFPVIPTHIYEKYPSYVETYFGMDSTDCHPMKTVLQVTAVALAINGSYGYFLTVRADDVARQKYFTELGHEDLGLSTCQRFRILGQTLNTLSTQTSPDVTE